ncbi:MAG: hypothetical protein V7746_16615 [Halioglobus sp.]
MATTMTTALEYRITRNLLKRRDSVVKKPSAAAFIKSVALFTVALVIVAAMPELLIPLFVGALLVSLGV